MAEPTRLEPVMKMPLGSVRWEILPGSSYDREGEGNCNTDEGPGDGAKAVKHILPTRDILVVGVQHAKLSRTHIEYL